MFDVKEQHCISTTEKLLYNIFKALEGQGAVKPEGRAGSRAGGPPRAPAGQSARTAGKKIGCPGSNTVEKI